MLPMFNPWEQLFLRGPIASQFVSDDDSAGKTEWFQQLAEELLRGSFVVMTLHQDTKDLTACIHCSPQVILLAFNGDHNLVKMPFISRLGATANLIGILLSKLFAPLPNRFVRHLNAAIEHHFLDVTVAQRKGEVEPDTGTNDLDGKPMVFVTDAHGLALTDADEGYHKS